MVFMFVIATSMGACNQRQCKSVDVLHLAEAVNYMYLLSYSASCIANWLRGSEVI